MATETETKMKALHYDGPFKVSVKEIDLPKIQHPDDVVRILSPATPPVTHKSLAKQDEL